MLNLAVALRRLATHQKTYSHGKAPCQMETVDSLDGPGRKQSLSFFPYRYISRPYPRNCQTLGVPRQSRGFTNLIIQDDLPVLMDAVREILRPESE